MKKLLYINYVDFANINSGSSVRPYKLYQAFQNLDLQLIVISGGKDRNQKIKELTENLEKIKPDYCYIEPASEMIFPMSDWKLFRRLHQLKIPTAFFYRDLFYKFPMKLFYSNLSLSNKLKIYIKRSLEKLAENRLAKYIDIFYFPSHQTSKLFQFQNKRILFPAGEILYKNSDSNMLTKVKANPSYIPKAIYVGAISDGYGTPLMIEAFKIINQNEIICELLLVCRKFEYEKSFLKDSAFPWLKIIHASSEKLKEIYKQADFSLLPLNSDHPYYNMAVAVKLFEYMSYALPIISTPTEAMAEIIQNYNIGIVTKNNSASELADAVLQLIKSPDKYKSYRQNIISALESENLWCHRVETIIHDLDKITK